MSSNIDKRKQRTPGKDHPWRNVMRKDISQARVRAGVAPTRPVDVATVEALGNDAWDEGLIADLVAEVRVIAEGCMPDGDHAPMHVVAWASEWAERLGEQGDE